MAESRDKSTDDRARTLDTGWGEGDLSKRGSDLSGRLSRPQGPQGAKPAVRLPVPPAAGESLERDEDAVESLFRGDQTLRAPSIPPAPSEAELSRWQATSRVSLFDERVSDPGPPPPAGVPRPSAEALRGMRTSELDAQPAPAPDAEPPPARDAVPPARAADPAPPPAAHADPALAPTLALAPAPAPALAPAADLAPPSARDVAPPPPPPPAPPSRAPTKQAPPMPADARNGVRSRAETEQLERDSLPHAVIERLAASGKAAAPARRRRLVHGPKAATLAMLGAAALLTLGSVAVLLGSRQNPVASAPPLARMPRGPAEAAAPQLPTPAPAPAPSPEQAAPAAEAAVAAAQGQPARPAAEPAAVAPEPAPQAQAAPVPAAAPPQPAQPAPPATAESAVPHAPQAKPTAPAAAPAAPTPDPAPAPAAEPRAAEPGAEQAETGPAADSDKLMAAARKLLADDEPERAEALMRELLARAPQDHHAMELLVRALMDQDRGKEALPFARKMVQRRSKRVPYRLLLGDVLLMVGDEAGARVEWQAALQLDPGDREIKRRLGL